MGQPHSGSSRTSTIAEVLAFFARECGWTPAQVFALSRAELEELAVSLVDVKNREKEFEAKLHDKKLKIPPAASRTRHKEQDLDQTLSRAKAAGFPIEDA